LCGSVDCATVLGPFPFSILPLRVPLQNGELGPRGPVAARVALGPRLSGVALGPRLSVAARVALGPRLSGIALGPRLSGIALGPRLSVAARIALGPSLPVLTVTARLSRVALWAGLPLRANIDRLRFEERSQSLLDSNYFASKKLGIFSGELNGARLVE